MLMLAPFAAFSQDADVLAALGDNSPLPMRWLAAAQVASRLADASAKERDQLLKTWTEQQGDAGADGVWSALNVPGIPVVDIESAVRALCAIGAEMERVGALNLAYTTVTHSRIAVLRGPAAVRGLAAVQQARVLRQMGYQEEASDTYEEARLDGIRAKDPELTGRALLGESALCAQQGNFPDALTKATKALDTFPPDSAYVPDAYLSLMAATSSLGDYQQAFDYGWRGYDACDTDADRRASVIANLATLALRLGRPAAARRGYLAVLGLSQVERVVLPSLSGLALVNAAMNDVDELRIVAHRLELRSALSPQPYEVARSLFELAQAWQQAGQHQDAEECLARARDLALRHGFHEVSHRSELLGEALAAAAAAPTREATIEAAIARFDELQVDSAILAEV
jgi:tetratricopeptide (TPR) repeat protein